MSTQFKVLAEERVLPGLRKLPNINLSSQAVAFITTVGLQESGLTARKNAQGDKLGYWQFTTKMVEKVLSGSTKDRAADLCQKTIGSTAVNLVWFSLEIRDELACQLARILLLKDPAPLPLPTVNNGIVAWDYYVRNWGAENLDSRRKNFIFIWEQVVKFVNELVNTPAPTTQTQKPVEVPKVSSELSISLTSANSGNIGVSINAQRRGLDVLHPSTKKKVVKLLELCQKNNLAVLVLDTVRTFEEQAELLKKVPVVTKAGPGQSPHNWGCAIDFCQNIKGKEYEDSFFPKVGKLAKEAGLFWGGDFKSFKDMPHIEDPEFILNNSTSDLVKRFGTFEKFKATWPK